MYSNNLVLSVDGSTPKAPAFRWNILMSNNYLLALYTVYIVHLNYWNKMEFETNNTLVQTYYTKHMHNYYTLQRATKLIQPHLCDQYIQEFICHLHTLTIGTENSNQFVCVDVWQLQSVANCWACKFIIEVYVIVGRLVLMLFNISFFCLSCAIEGFLNYCPINCNPITHWIKVNVQKKYWNILCFV